MYYEKLKEIQQLEGIARVELLSKNDGQCRLKVVFEPKVFCAIPVHWDFLCDVLDKPELKTVYRGANDIHCMDMYKGEPVNGYCSDSIKFQEYIKIKNLVLQWADYAARSIRKDREVVL